MKTITLFDIKDFHGNVIGSFIRNVSAREELDMRIMRKLFNDSIKDSIGFRTPVFDDGTIPIRADVYIHPSLKK